MHGGEFFTTRDSSGYRDWPQSNAEKNAAPWKINFSQSLFRDAARTGMAQLGAACIVAPAMISRTVYLFVGPYLTLFTWYKYIS